MTVPEDTLDPEIDRPPPSSSPKSPPSWRPLVARLHFYAGVLVGPFLLVAALTGGLYAMAPTIERFGYGELLSVEPTGEPLPLRDQVAAACTAYPDLSVTSVRPPASATDSTRVSFADPALDEESLRAVFVDPYTGRVLGSEPTWFGYLPVSTWLDGLHRHLNLGEPGRVYSEVAASWLWVVALGGLYLWLVKARGDRRRGRVGRVFTVDRSTRGRSRTLNWHGATGVWLLAALLFLSATGITWSTYAGAHVTDLRAALGWQRPQLDTTVSFGAEPAGATDVTHPPGGEHAGHGMAAAAAVDDPVAVDFEAVLAAAARAGVALPVEVTLPADPGQAIGVTELDKPYRLTTNAAAVDPVSLSVTSEIDYWRDYSPVAMLADWGIRAHMGFLFGLLNQLLLLSVAVGLVTIIGRGYLMWWQRRPTRSSAWALGRPPLRGGLRRIQPAALAGLVIVVTAVGWFLPLLGLSLLGFLVVDVLIGLVKRRRGAVEVESGTVSTGPG